MLYKPGANKPRAVLCAGVVRRDTLSHSKPPARTQLTSGTTKAQQKKHQQPGEGDGRSIVGSRATNRSGSPSSTSRAVSQPDLTASSIVSNRKSVKSRLVKSADPKFIEVGPVAPTPLSEAVANEMQEVNSLAVPTNLISTLVRAKIAVTKWRSFHARKKIDTYQETVIRRLALNSAPLPRQRYSTKS